ncbi:DUF3093 domain-containing protein [Kribbella sp. NPDC058245]|uniref:DUF3093 domain-containing protein n=1 Tax=Kribbella sp. NPDC058245 TaxID=3346399 RepID=UPI0036EEAA16
MPVSWWIISAAAVVTLFAITAVPVGLLAGLIVAAVTVAVLLAILLRYGAARVEVDTEHLRAGRAVIERAHLGAAEALTGEAARNAFGRDCDPKAYLLLRSYASGAVRVAINDPSDPTPYWVLATRHPERLAAALSGHSVTRS